ncbi:MAG: mandelate racemase/muconate lactonizing enzyme family protein [Caldilineaceae bacterium]|nr:mandelate racemase/muconate lactonizing enzyme family protein [Caldilineaceae bacterium]
MKITDIKVYPVWVGSRNQLLVKIETDEGIYGWGEAGLSFRELAVAGAVRHYREWLIGRDPMQRGALWQEMYRSQYFEGGRVLTAAISAIDIALHDIVGKALNVPIYQLLGGKQRDYVPCFATTGAHGDRLIEDVKLLLAEGWNVIRTVPSHPQRMSGSPMNVATQQARRGPQPGDTTWEPRDSIGPTAADLVRVREELGGDFVLGIDYHHRLNVAETASFCRRMPSGTLDFIEEPIRDETPEAYEALRRMVDIPFAIGEEFSSKWAFVPYIERGITDFVRIDISNVGGFTEAMKVAGWAEAHYIDLMPHNPLGPICTAATVHLAAAVANFSWLEVRVSPTEQLGFYDETIFPVQLKLEGAHFPVPTDPGLGVEVDEAYVARQEFKFAEAPHLRKRDGSYTNW